MSFLTMLEALPGDVTELVLVCLVRSLPETHCAADGSGWRGARIGKERWEMFNKLRLVSKRIRAVVEGYGEFAHMQYDRDLRLRNREQVSAFASKSC